jgi:hypothetical protein
MNTINGDTNARQGRQSMAALSTRRRSVHAPAHTLHPAAAATPPPYQVAAVYTRESYWLEQMADAEPTTDTYCGE